MSKYILTGKVENNHISVNLTFSTENYIMISTFNNKNLIDQVLKGQKGEYKILDKLDEGGFGEIYLAEDISNQNQKYVVKLLKPKQNSNREDFEERKRLFKREAEHLNKLDHSQIKRLFCH